MAVFPWGPLISGGAALGSAVLNYMSNRHTNETNVEMNDATNEMNYQIAMENNNFNREERLASQDFNRAMWYEQQDYMNKYNSPAEQIKRLQAAGLNPALAFGGDNTMQSVGQVQTSPASAYSAAPMVAPRVSNEFDASMITNPLNAFMTALSQHEDIKGKHIDNEIKLGTAKSQVEKAKWEALETMHNARKGSKEYEIAVQTLRQAMARSAIIELEANRGNILAQQHDDMFQSTMQSLKDQHDESVLKQASIKLQNMLAVKLDRRQQQELQALLARTKQEIDESRSRSELNRETVHGMKEKLLHEIDNLVSDTNLKTQQYNTNKPNENRSLDTVVGQNNDKLFGVLDWLFNYLGASTLGQIKL